MRGCANSIFPLTMAAVEEEEVLQAKASTLVVEALQASTRVPTQVFPVVDQDLGPRSASPALATRLPWARPLRGDLHQTASILG